MAKKKSSEIWEKEFSAKPVMDFAKKFTSAVIPTEEDKKKKILKKLEELKTKIEVKQLELEYANLLKKLEEVKED